MKPIALPLLVLISCSDASSGVASTAASKSLYRSYMPPGLVAGSMPVPYGYLQGDQSGCFAAHRALLERAMEWKAAPADDSCELSRVATQYSRTWGAHPEPFLACFQGVARDRIAALWILSACFLDLEVEVDRACGSGAWRDITCDYSFESRLAACTLPDALLGVRAFGELVCSEPTRRTSMIGDGEAELVDPQSGTPVFFGAKSDDSTQPTELQFNFTLDHLSSCGIAFEKADEFMPNAVPIATRAGGGWVWASCYVIDVMRQAIDESADQEPAPRKRLLADKLLNLVCRCRLNGVSRLPIDVQQSLRMSVVLDQITGGAWRGNSGTGSWGNAQFNSSFPIITPTGVNPILLGGQANQFSFGSRR